MFNRQWQKKMNELKSNRKFRKPSPVADAAGLSSLLGFLNDPRITGASPPPKESPVAAEAVKVAPIAAQPTPQVQAPSQASAAPASLTRVFLTGRLKSGKDYLAEQAGCKIFALADPLYFMAGYFFGPRPKDEARNFLQTVGQWGRGEVSAHYPLTTERACFIETVRKLSSTWAEGPASSFCVNWRSYGQNENIWLDSLIARVRAEPAGTRTAVSGVRFQNEYARLVAEGFEAFHVMTSAVTWAARLQKVGLTPDSPTCKDVSEQLAASLDQNVIQTLSKAKHGAKLKCVWSDEKQQAPSQRLLTVAEFVSMFPKI